MRDIERAKGLLQTEDCSCVLVKGDIIYTSRKRIAPWWNFFPRAQVSMVFSAADKIVGKALPLLFALAGAREIYAPVMSGSAPPVLQAKRDCLFPAIRLRRLSKRVEPGPVPWKAVAGIDDRAGIHSDQDRNGAPGKRTGGNL